MKEKTNWAVYIEGMTPPWENGLTKSEAEKCAISFRGWGVHSAAQEIGYTDKTRQQGCNVKEE